MATETPAVRTEEHIYVGTINAIYLLLMTLGYFAFRLEPGRLTRIESDGDD